nr:hypothetical protein [Chloroflexota bacterium]
MKRAHLSPDEATLRDQVRRTLDVLTVVASVVAALLGAQAVASGNVGYGVIATLVAGFGVLLVAWPRRILADGRVESAVMVMALAGTAVILVSAIIAPYGGLTVATLLIPIIAAVPYLGVRSLRRLMILAWAGTVATAAAGLLPGAPAAE